MLRAKFCEPPKSLSLPVDEPHLGFPAGDVGGTEQNIAGAFAEARDTILVFDEADAPACAGFWSSCGSIG